MRNALNFLFCLAVAVVLTIEISGTGGVFVIVLLLCALFVSAAVLVLTKKFLRVNVSLSTAIVNKGESFEAQIFVDKNFILPTCFVEAEIGYTPNVTADDTVKFKFISAKKNGETLTVPLKADLSGSAQVYLKSVILYDYLGIIHSKLKTAHTPCEIRIIPNIPDTGTQTEVLKSTSENMSFDDSDEESDETALASTGVPGFDHRQYVVGDPLKRINWKLSSKKNNLMVRLDEKVTSSSQIFVLDYPAANNMNRLYYENADKITEAALAMLSMLLKEGYESDFNVNLDGWKTFTVKDYKTLQYLQEQLCALKPCSPAQRFPDADYNKKGKAEICFSTVTTDTKKEISTLLAETHGSIVVTKTSGVGKLAPNMWAVSDDFEFEKM